MICPAPHVMPGDRLVRQILERGRARRPPAGAPPAHVRGQPGRGRAVSLAHGPRDLRPQRAHARHVRGDPPALGGARAHGERHRPIFTPRRRDAPRRARCSEVRVPESVTITGELASGAQYSVHFSGVAAFAPSDAIELYGTQGRAPLRRADPPDPDGPRGPGPPRAPGPALARSRCRSRWRSRPTCAATWTVEADFAAAIREGHAVYPSFDDGVAYMEFVEAVARSIAGGAHDPPPARLTRDPRRARSSTTSHAGARDRLCAGAGGAVASAASAILIRQGLRGARPTRGVGQRGGGHGRPLVRAPPSRAGRAAPLEGLASSSSPASWARWPAGCCASSPSTRSAASVASALNNQLPVRLHRARHPAPRRTGDAAILTGTVGDRGRDRAALAERQADGLPPRAPRAAAPLRNVLRRGADPEEARALHDGPGAGLRDQRDDGARGVHAVPGRARATCGPSRARGGARRTSWPRGSRRTSACS